MEHSQEIILVVEDEDIARKNLEHILKKEGYRVIAVNRGRKAIDWLNKENFDLVITDLKMKKTDGMQILEKTKDLQPYTEVIMVTGFATVDSAVKAMRDGAYHYIAKPYNIDAVRQVVREALLKRRLRMENLELKDTLEKSQLISPLIGKSAAMMAVQKTINQIGPSDINVLILGESGTGKELAAKAIHGLSHRAKKKFIAFNCGSFTEDLMANELFGHEKDAFTGATKKKSGLIEVADGGTIFLDEIGDMPLTMQVKLLRVIQEREFVRVGGVDPIPVDVRFIAATHHDLKEDVKKGHFRQDLYYRLNVITLHLPPLADREGDIPLLVHHFMAQKNKAMNKAVYDIDREAMNLLCQYSWPGNVRELENAVERALALENGEAIRVDDLPDYIQNLSIETFRQSSSAIVTLEEQEKRYITWVLEKHQGNKTKAAKTMGIDRVSLWRKIKRYNLEDNSD